MRKLFIILIFLVLGLFFAYTRIEGILESQVRIQFAKYLSPQGIHLDFASLKIAWGLPLTVRLLNVTVMANQVPQGEIEEIDLTLGMVGGYLKVKDFFPEIRVLIKNAKINFDLGEKKPDVAPPPQAPEMPKPFQMQSLSDLSGLVPRMSNLRFQVKVENFNFELRQDNQMLFAIKEFQLLTSLEDLAAPLNLTFSGFAKSERSIFSFWIPIAFNAKLKFEQGRVAVLRADSKILALDSSLTGYLDLNQRDYSLQLQAQIADLEKVSIPPHLNLPILAWRGALKSFLYIKGTFDRPTYEGGLDLSRSEFKLDFKQDDVEATGQMMAKGHLEFKGGQFFELKKSDAEIDLTGLAVTYGNLFRKPAEVPLIIRASGHMDRLVTLDSLFMKLSQLEADVAGSLDLNQSRALPASLKVEVHPTHLQGLERFFLPLSQHPMVGLVSLKGTVAGDLKKLSQAKIQLSDLTLKNVSTAVKFSNPDLQLEGPVALSLDGRLALENMAVISGATSLSADLTGLKIRYKKLFAKNQNELLKIALAAEKKGIALSLRASQLSTPAGSLQFSGQPPLGMTAPMDLHLDCKGLNLTQLKAWLPSYQDLMPEGNLQFSAHLKGHLDSEDMMKSPLAVRASVAVKMPKFVYVKPETAQKVKTLAPKPKPPEAFLPETPLIKNLRLSLDLSLGEFEMDPLRMSGVQIRSEIADGMSTSSVGIANIFEGAMQVSHIKLNLLQRDPVISFDFLGQKLKIESMLGWAMPQYQRLIRGQTDLSTVGSAKLPWAPDFVDSINVGGDFTLDNGVLNTLELAEMIKGVASQIPGFKVDTLTSRGPLQAKISGKYRIKDSQIAVNPLRAVTARHEELLIKGRVDPNLNMDMSGSLFLVEALSGSFFEANKDAQGRLEIPLLLQGAALKPEFKFAQETISKMTGRMVEYEKKKAVSKIETQIKSEIEKKKEDLQKNLSKEVPKDFSEDLKKKAEKLFH